MKVKPMGMLWMILAGWLNRLPGATWRTPEVLPEGRLMDRMNKLTALDASAKGIQRYVDLINRELRTTAPANERSTQEWATVFRVGLKRKQFVKKFVSEQWILSCKSLGRSLVYHL